eukprot:2033198-Amphidinium_carterae.1
MSSLRGCCQARSEQRDFPLTIAMRNVRTRDPLLDVSSEGDPSLDMPQFVSSRGSICFDPRASAVDARWDGPVTLSHRAM